jgi:glutamate dehydrogenase (NAD(P)+)
VSTRSALSKLKINIVGATTAVQGFGNVGSISAKLLASQGMKVVAISDVSGAYHNADGIDVEAAIAFRDGNKGTLEGFAAGKKISNAELLELDVDVLVPAAMEDQITAENADRIKKKTMCTQISPILRDRPEVQALGASWPESSL